MEKKGYVPDSIQAIRGENIQRVTEQTRLKNAKTFAKDGCH
jgi:hypothetical protein